MSIAIQNALIAVILKIRETCKKCQEPLKFNPLNTVHLMKYFYTNNHCLSTEVPTPLTQALPFKKKITLLFLKWFLCITKYLQKDNAEFVDYSHWFWYFIPDLNDLGLVCVCVTSDASLAWHITHSPNSFTDSKFCMVGGTLWMNSP